MTSPRPATSADLPHVAALAAEAGFQTWSVEALSEEVMRDRADLVVVGPTGEVVGFALMWTIADEGEVLLVAVAASHRRTGLGGALLDALEARALQRGATELYLEVAEDNGPARAFYRARGFVERGLRPGYYGGRAAAVLMSAHVRRGAVVRW